MYTIVEIKQTCFACPSQWEGKTEDGKDVYIRYRHGCLRLDINGETFVELDNLGDGLDGCIDLSEVLAHFQGSITLSKEAEKKYYEF